MQSKAKQFPAFRQGLTAAMICLAGFATSMDAETVRLAVAGHYEYTGAAPSPTADFTLTVTLDRHPVVCGGGEGLSIVCGVSLPVYDNGPLHVVLGEPSLRFKDAGHKGGLDLYQDDTALNRLGFVIGSSQLWSGTLADLTLVDGVYDICPAHFGQVHDYLMTDLCSYAGQGFASGDVANNPFQDPVTLQSDDPILSGTITIASDTAAATGPALAIALAGDQLALQWLATTGFGLEQTTHPAAGNWLAVTNTPTLNNSTNFVTLTREAVVKFFRLRKP